MKISDNMASENAFIKRRSKTILVLLVFVILAAYVLKANPFAGESVAPFDILMVFPGWSTIPSNHSVVHGGRSDVLDAQLPTWITLKKQIRSGEGALWYPYGAGGMPITLEICNPAFLLFLSIKDDAVALYVVGLMKLFVSGFGVYLLLRVYLHWLPSVWGGFVFMLCGFNAAWFFWDHVTTAMWIPWILWSTVMYLKTESKKWLPIITLTSLLCIFGGFPAVAAFGFYSFGLLLLIWNTYTIYVEREPASVMDRARLNLFAQKNAFPLIAVAIAFVLASIILVPFIDSMSGINLSHRTGGGTAFGIQDLKEFIMYGTPPAIETNAYVGNIAIALAIIGLLSLLYVKDKGYRAFICFIIILLILSVLLAFGALPHRFIRMLPIFSFNPWNRLVIISLLALAVLSSMGMQVMLMEAPQYMNRYLKMSPPFAKGLVILIVIAMIILQFKTQKQHFRSLNAVVPAAWFYPATPSLSYVKERLGPLQSVIADKAYYYAGTLGAYGISEWYAHGFRTDREKEVLYELVRNSYSSPTSMFIKKGEDIQLQSPMINKLGIKYLLVYKHQKDLTELWSVPETTRVPAPSLPDNAWVQHMRLPTDIRINSVNVLLATYYKDFAPANAVLTLRHGDHGALIASAELDKRQITDNCRASFVFAEAITLKKGEYSFTLSLSNYKGPEKITAWATSATLNSGNYLSVNGVKTNLSLICQLSGSDKWKQINLEKDIAIYENRQVANSAYFINNLDEENDQLDYSGLDVKLHSAQMISVAYSKSEAGWIVLPMRYQNGWKAFVNKLPVDYGQYLGIMPAIPVKSGTGELLFKYEPGSFRIGAIFSIIGVIVFLVFYRFCASKEKWL